MTTTFQSDAARTSGHTHQASRGLRHLDGCEPLLSIPVQDGLSRRRESIDVRCR